MNETQAVRAHERDYEVIEADGTRWHQTGPDDAHERWQCDLTWCGWEQIDA